MAVRLTLSPRSDYGTTWRLGTTTARLRKLLTSWSTYRFGGASVRLRRRARQHPLPYRLHEGASHQAVHRRGGNPGGGPGQGLRRETHRLRPHHLLQREEVLLRGVRREGAAAPNDPRAVRPPHPRRCPRNGAGPTGGGGEGRRPAGGARGSAGDDHLQRLGRGVPQGGAAPEEAATGGRAVPRPPTGAEEARKAESRRRGEAHRGDHRGPLGEPASRQDHPPRRRDRDGRDGLAGEHVRKPVVGGRSSLPLARGALGRHHHQPRQGDQALPRGPTARPGAQRRRVREGGRPFRRDRGPV